MTRLGPAVLLVLAVFVLTSPATVVSGASIMDIRENVRKMVEPVEQNMPKISVKELKRKMDRHEKVLIVDVRSRSEYEAGHILGALYIDRGELEWKTPLIITDPDAQIVVQCSTGPRSAMSAKTLMEMGYTNVRVLKGAFKAWLQAGYPMYNSHGEFTLNPGGYRKREPR